LTRPQSQPAYENLEPGGVLAQTENQVLLCCCDLWLPGSAMCCLSRLPIVCTNASNAFVAASASTRLLELNADKTASVNARAAPSRGFVAMPPVPASRPLVTPNPSKSPNTPVPARSPPLAAFRQFLTVFESRWGSIQLDILKQASIAPPLTSR
jgi:hypothetical protein